jgi:hypothetical protein
MVGIISHRLNREQGKCRKLAMRDKNMIKVKLEQLLISLIFPCVGFGITTSYPSIGNAETGYQRYQRLWARHIQGLRYCQQFENRVKSNPRDYIALREFNECRLRIYKMGICQQQQILAVGAGQRVDDAECLKPLADYATYIDGRNQ